jgi:hypothetical protein
MSFTYLGNQLCFKGKDESEEGYLVRSTGEYKLDDVEILV